MKDRVLNILMLLMVALALGVSFFQGGKEEKAAFTGAFQANPTLSPTETPDPIASYRSQREKQRKEELSALSVLLELEGEDDSLRKLAGEQMLEITQNAEVELAIEAALSARGQEGICVFRKGKMTIFISDTLDEATASLISHLAMEIGGVAMENIRIAAC